MTRVETGTLAAFRGLRDEHPLLDRSCRRAYRAWYAAPLRYRYWRTVRQAGGRRGTVLFSPERPTCFHSLAKTCYLSGCAMTTDPRRTDADLVVSFRDATFNPPDAWLTELARSRPVVNLRCADISKATVNRVFERVFGYDLEVDPETHTGWCVAKSDQNATHDGVLRRCPTGREPGRVYQKLVDNRCGDLCVVIRPVIMAGTIPFVYYKHIFESERFGNDSAAARIVETADAFSDDEVATILRFCAEIGLELGELDVARDNEDGRIYVLDANSTPFGPAHRLRPAEYEAALRRLSAAFSATFLTGAPGAWPALEARQAAGAAAPTARVAAPRPAAPQAARPPR